eukprot:gene5980-7451_t
MIKICGQVPGLGGWKIENALNMSWGPDNWWTGEYQCEVFSCLPKNNFKLDTPMYYSYPKPIHLNNNSSLLYNSSSLTPLLHQQQQQQNSSNNNRATSSRSSSRNSNSKQQQYQLNSNQKLSPVLKGVLPQFIDIEYKYVIFEDYTMKWESGNNHKVSFMAWSNKEGSMGNDEEEELYIEIRDEWCGGNGVFPTLDFQSEKAIDDDNERLMNVETIKPYSFLHPLDPHVVPIYPSQICTFIVTDEGGPESHSVNLVSHFFGQESQSSIRMIPIIQAGSSNTLWIGQVYAPQPMKFEYRYVVSSSNNSGVYWEKDIRQFSSSNNNPTVIINNDGPLRVSEASSSWIKTGFVGLQEQDFNCSLLSVVQLLYHIDPLREILINLRGRIGFPITQCLANIYTSMHKGCQTTEVGPLQSIIGPSNDPAEILNIILPNLIDETSRISQISNNDQDVSINHIIEGELSRTSISIDKQGSVTSMKTSNEKFVNIILSTKGFTNMEESLQFSLHNTEKYEDCSFENIINFETMPQIFIVQLDHSDYTSHGIVSLNDRFSFPKKLTLKDIQYRILGILCHTGEDALVPGHFFLFIKRNKKWIKCDGSQISFVTEREVYQSFGGVGSNYLAYLVVYSKLDQSQ